MRNRQNWEVGQVGVRYRGQEPHSAADNNKRPDASTQRPERF